MEKRIFRRADLEALFGRAVDAAAPFERPLVRVMLAELREELELEPDAAAAAGGSAVGGGAEEGADAEGSLVGAG